jgi:hypothetical protein
LAFPLAAASSGQQLEFLSVAHRYVWRISPEGKWDCLRANQPILPLDTLYAGCAAMEGLLIGQSTYTPLAVLAAQSHDWPLDCQICLVTAIAYCLADISKTWLQHLGVTSMTSSKWAQISDCLLLRAIAAAESVFPRFFSQLDHEILACLLSHADAPGRTDYVGAQGRRTPFTKCLHLELPFESLRGLRVVDTPGLNDPIVSREYRTQSMLHECDAVFIVSPAGQFLNQTDESLMERLSTREGVRTFYVIASQFDTQLFGHEYQRHAGNLPDVIQTQQASLARHAGNVFASWAETNPSLAILATDGGKALRISSSISHVLLETLPERWDENAQFVHHQLCTKYPDYFASAASSKEWLTRLSGIPQLKNDLVDVGENKTEIFKTRINDYLAGQEYACRTWIQALLKRAEERNREFESSDILTIEARIQQLANIASNGVDVANEVFSDQIEDRRLEIGRELKKRVEEQFKEATEESSRSKGETTERHQRRGVGAWFAKVLWGGGYEEVSVQTVETKGVRTAITDFRNVLIDDLNRYIAEKNKRWRDEISKAIIARLRDEMGDEHVRSDDIRRITKSILLGFSDLPAPELPDLPKELAATGTLRDSRVGPYMDEAEKYLDVLKEKGIGFSREIEGKLKNLKGEPVGARIFGGLRDEAESLKLQLQNKRLTAEKYVHLRNVLKDISV